MSKKQILFDEACRRKVLAGVSILAKAVKVTLGPKGRNVMIDKKFGAPKVTKDGVTVAKEIELDCPFENMGAQMVREVASKTADKAGDGTTTATVLAEAIYKEGLKSVAAGSNPIFIKRGIDRATEAIVAELANISKKIKTRAEIKQVATVSANWDASIGDIIADAMDKSARMAPSRSKKPRPSKPPLMWSKVCNSTKVTSHLTSQPMRKPSRPYSKTLTFSSTRRRCHR